MMLRANLIAYASLAPSTVTLPLMEVCFNLGASWLWLAWYVDKRHQRR